MEKQLNIDLTAQGAENQQVRLTIAIINHAKKRYFLTRSKHSFSDYRKMINNVRGRVILDRLDLAAAPLDLVSGVELIKFKTNREARAELSSQGFIDYTADCRAAVKVHNDSVRKRREAPKKIDIPVITDFKGYAEIFAGKPGKIQQMIDLNNQSEEKAGFNREYNRGVYAGAVQIFEDLLKYLKAEERPEVVLNNLVNSISSHIGVYGDSIYKNKRLEED